jgi:hypothetical protein
VLTRVASGGTTFLGSEVTLDGSGGGTFSISAIRSFSASATITAACQYVGGSAYVIGGNATDADTQTALTLMWLGRTS